MADEKALRTLALAGIENAESFTAFLAEMDSRAVKALKDVPPLERIDNGEDYRYCKNALSAYRKLKKEAEDGRKRVTGELDRAKKACMSFVADSIAPLDAAIGSMSALQKAFEERGRAEKRERLQSFWETEFPALALCTGEASEPLVAFDRVFDPDWTKRVGELASDAKAQDAMRAVAASLAAYQREIEASGHDAETKRLAVARMFETLECRGCIEWAVEEQRRRSDAARLMESRADSVVDARPQDAPEAAPAPVAGQAAPSAQGAADKPAGAPTRREVTFSLPCEPPCGRVLCVWIETDGDLRAAREAMVSAGLHGCIGKVM